MKKKFTLITIFLFMLLLTACNNSEEQIEEFGDIVITSSSNEIINTHTQPIDYSEIDCDKYISVNKYEDLIDTSKLVTTDEEIQEQLEQIASSMTVSSTKLTEGTVEENSNINIAYIIKENDNELVNVLDKDITIGKEDIYTGIDSQLIGKNVGDILSTNIEYPSDYFDVNLAGKNVTIDITINYINSDVVTREVNDEFAEYFSNGEYKTLDELKQSIKEEISTSRLEQSSDDLMKKILENTEIIGDTSKFEETEYLIQLDKCVALVKGEKLTYDELANLYALNSVDEAKKYYKELASNIVKEKLVIYKFAKMFNISVSEEEYKAYKSELAKYSPEEIIQSMDENDIKYKLLYEKVLKNLLQK